MNSKILSAKTEQELDKLIADAIAAG